MAGVNRKAYRLCLAAAVLAAGPSLATDDGDWRVYSEEANGDVYFYDAAQVKTEDDVRTVWMRIRYKNSVMAASSYQSLLAIDCAARTEQTLERTFYSDKAWKQPAMATDAKKKRKRSIKEGSANERLFDLLCPS